MDSPEGNPIPLLHRRLFGATSGQARVTATTKDRTTNTTAVGMGGEHGEVRVNTQQNSTVIGATFMTERALVRVPDDRGQSIQTQIAAILVAPKSLKT